MNNHRNSFSMNLSWERWRLAGVPLLTTQQLAGETPAFPGRSWSVLATSYTTWLALRGKWVGPLFWPAVVLHPVLTLLLGRAWFLSPKKGGRNNHVGES